MFSAKVHDLSMFTSASSAKSNAHNGGGMLAPFICLLPRLAARYPGRFNSTENHGTVSRRRTRTISQAGESERYGTLRPGGVSHCTIGAPCFFSWHPVELPRRHLIVAAALSANGHPTRSWTWTSQPRDSCARSAPTLMALSSFRSRSVRSKQRGHWRGRGGL